MEEIVQISNPSDLTHLKNRRPFEFKCVDCGNIHKINQFRRGRLERYETMLCENCYREKCSMEKYGTKNPMQSQICLRKQSDTNYRIYGTRSALQNPEVRKKTLNHNKIKYGVNYYVESEEFKQKSASKKMELYGSSTYSNAEKRKETFVEMYGVDNPMKVESIKNKSIDNRRKTRELKPMLFQSKKWFYDFNSFDTFSELSIYVYCKYFGIPIYRNYSIGIDYLDANNKKRKTYPDFIINGMFYEIKGLIDFDGEKLINKYKRHRLYNGDLVEYTEDELRNIQITLNNKQEAMMRAGVTILLETCDWINMCREFTKNILPNYKIFNKFNLDNVRFGYTPYNFNPNDIYQTPIGLGSFPM